LIQNKKAVPAKFFLFKLVSQEIRTKFEIITKYVIHMLRLLAKRFISLDPKEPVAVPQSATAKQTRKPRRHVWFNQQNPQISSAEVQAQEAENRRLEAEREQRLAVNDNLLIVARGATTLKNSLTGSSSNCTSINWTR
jgi:hypothetical protein